jgi:hypothetical protein
LPHKTWQSQEKGFYQFTALAEEIANFSISFERRKYDELIYQGGNTLRAQALNGLLNYLSGQPLSVHETEGSPWYTSINQTRLNIANKILMFYSGRSVLALGNAVYRYTQERRVLAKERSDLAEEFELLQKAHGGDPKTIPAILSEGTPSSTDHCQGRGTIEGKFAAFGPKDRCSVEVFGMGNFQRRLND